MKSGAFITTAILNDNKSLILASRSVEAWLFLSRSSTFNILAPGKFPQSFSVKLMSFMKSVSARRLCRLEFM